MTLEQIVFGITFAHLVTRPGAQVQEAAETARTLAYVAQARWELNEAIAKASQEGASTTTLDAEFTEVVPEMRQVHGQEEEPN